MACPFLTSSSRKLCSASSKLVVLCIEELNGKCMVDSKYPECELYQQYKKETIIQ
ncbi:MAG: hypothetical protein ABII27_04005 [bacterium]